MLGWVLSSVLNYVLSDKWSVALSVQLCLVTRLEDEGDSRGARVPKNVIVCHTSCS